MLAVAVVAPLMVRVPAAAQEGPPSEAESPGPVDPLVGEVGGSLQRVAADTELAWASARESLALAALGEKARPDGRVPVLADVSTFVPPVPDEPSPTVVEPDVRVLSPTTTATTNPDGTETLRVTSGPLLFQDGDEQWRYMDLQLVHSQDGGWLQPRSAPAGRFKIAARARSGEPLMMVSTEAGEFALRQPGLAPLDSLTMESVLGGAAAVLPAGLTSGADVVLQPVLNGVKQSFVIDEGMPGTVEVQVSMPAGVSARQVSGDPASMEEPGWSGVEFVRDADGQVVASYGDGVAFDAADTEQLGAPAPVAVELVGQQDKTVTIAVAVDAGWLAAPERQFPVVIDPTFGGHLPASGSQGTTARCKSDRTYSTYYDCDVYVNSDNPYGEYHLQTELRVGSPGYTEYDGSGNNRTRAFLLWHTDNLSDPAVKKQVVSAMVLMRPYYSASTSTRSFRLYGNKTQPWAGTDWMDHPHRLGGSTAQLEVGKLTHLTGEDPNYSRWLSFRSQDNSALRNHVQTWFDSSTGNRGFRIEAADERSTYYFKKFYSAENGTYSRAPFLEIVYNYVNRRPNVPTLKAPGDGAFYKTGQPSLLRARFSDPDLYDDSGNVLQFRYRLKGSTDGFTYKGVTVSANPSLGEVALPSLPPDEYEWSARGKDKHGLWSGWAVDRTFTINAAPTASEGTVGMPAASDGQQSLRFPSKYTDPDGDAGNIAFHIQRRTSPTSAWESFGANTTISASHGQTRTHSIQVPVSNETSYRWYAKATDAHGKTETTNTWKVFSPNYAEPGPVPSVTSTSHTAGGYSQDLTISMSWGAPSAPAGVAGYRYFFSPDPEGPGRDSDLWDTDAERLGAAARSVTSVPLPSGDWYFHILAVDTLGQRSTAVSTAGPYRLEGPELGRLGWDGYAGWSGGINATLSNYVRTDTDLAVPSVGGRLELSRTYNSRDTRAGWFGRGWTSNWEVSLDDRGDHAMMLYPDGRRERHELTNGTYSAPDGYFSQLVVAGSGWQLTAKDGTVHRFDADGRLVEIRDSNGNATTLAYTDGHLSVITDVASGRTLSWDWHGDGRVASVTSSDVDGPGTGLTASYVYSDTDDSIQACDARAEFGRAGHCMVYSYNQGRLSSVRSPENVDGTLGGDPAGQRVLIELDYAPDTGAIESTAVPAADPAHPQAGKDTNVDMEVTTFEAGVANGDGETTVTVTDPRGNQQAMVYDADYQLVRHLLPGDDGTPSDAFATTYEYTGGLRTSITDATKVTTTLTHDERGNVIGKVIDQTGTGMGGGVAVFSHAYEYDDRDLLVAEWDPRGVPDAWDPAADDPFAALDNAYRTVHTYDTGRNRTSTLTPPTDQHPDGTCRTWVWSDGTGAVPAGRLLAEYAPTQTDPSTAGVGGCALRAGAVGTTHSYEADGDRTGTVTPTGLTTTYDHDGLGRRMARTVTDADATEGGLSATTSWVYDELGNITFETGPKVGNPLAGVHQAVTTRTFDADNRLISETVADAAGDDQPRTRTYAYDDAGRLIAETDPDGQTERYGYDPAGNRVSTVDRSGRTIVIDYTARDEPTSTTHVAFDDPTGHSDTATPGDNVVLAERTWDAAGRPATETDGRGATVAIVHDGMDREVSRTLTNYADDPGGPAREMLLHRTDYDQAGHVVRETVGDGTRNLQVTEYRVDAAGWRRQTTRKDPAGDVVTDHTHDRNGNVTVTATTGPDGHGGTRTETVTGTYDAADRRTSTTTANTGQPDSQLTTWFSHDQRGNTTATTDPRASGPGEPAYTTTATFDAAGRQVTNTLPTIEVSPNGQAPTGIDDATVTSGYDTFGALTHVTDRRGNLTSHSYDRLGRKTGTVHPTYTNPVDGQTLTPSETWDHDATGNVLFHVNRRGERTDYRYDTLDRQVVETRPAVDAGTPQLVRRYDVTGNQTAQIDPDGQVTTATFDLAGRLRTQTDHTDTVTTAAVADGTSDGTVTTGKATTTVWTRDDLGQPTETVRRDDPDIADDTTPTATWSQTFTVDQIGRTTATSDADGHQWTTRFDLADRPTVETDPTGERRVHRYDLAGRHLDTRAYPATGSNPDGLLETRSWTYDAAGNTVSWTSPAGHGPDGDRTTGYTRTVAYDGANRPTTATQQVDATTADIVVGYRHDADGNLTGLVNGRGHLTATTYTPWGTTEKVIEPSTDAYPAPEDRTWTTGYDPGGLPTVEIQPGNVRIDRTFDPAGRLTREAGTPPDTDAGPVLAAPATRTYGYDLSGRLTAFSHPDGNQTITYNGLDLPATISRPGASQADTTYDYDPAGRPTRRADATGTATFAWDQRDLPDQMTDPNTGTISFDHDADGRLVGIGYADTLVRTRTYDGLDRLTTDTLTRPSDGAVLAKYAVDHDADGQIAAIDTAYGPAGGAVLGLLDNPAEGTHTYGYDQAGRLIDWDGPGPQSGASYGWDAAGNRTQVDAATYDYNARNQRTTGADGPWAYTARGTAVVAAGQLQTHDALGRQTDTGPTAATYDTLDRIGSTDIGVLADTDGRQQLIDALGQVTDLTGIVNDLQDIVYLDPTLPEPGPTTFRYEGTGIDPVTIGDAEHVRDTTGMIISIDADGDDGTRPPGWAGTNPHGDLAWTASANASLLDPAGQLTATRIYSPFGEPAGTSGSTDRLATLGFQSDHTDPVASQVWMGARWYQPSSGTFTSRDPLPGDHLNPITTNRYPYGAANPLRYIDPDGRAIIEGTGSGQAEGQRAERQPNRPQTISGDSCTERTCGPPAEARTAAREADAAWLIAADRRSACGRTAYLHYGTGQLPCGPTGAGTPTGLLALLVALDDRIHEFGAGLGQGTADVIGGVEGLSQLTGDCLFGFVPEYYDFERCGHTLAGISHALTHPGETWDAIYADFSQTHDEYGTTGLIGRLLPELVLAVTGMRTATAPTALTRTQRLSSHLPSAPRALDDVASSRLWSRTEFGGNRVYQRSDLIDSALVDARGRTNLERMQRGLAPIGPDGQSINLHHMLQTADGPIAEVTAKMHQQYSRVLHINPGSVGSGIDRTAFNAWRRDYWRTRACDFGGC